jgi:hypothetical protein
MLAHFKMSGAARLAVCTVTDPTELQKSLVTEATYLRGRILTSYAQIEFLLADLSVKLELKFPYLINDRIKAAKRIAERPGYESYREVLHQVCDDLLQYDEIRNFMAHGFLMLTTDKKGNHEFDMRRYQRDGEGKFSLIEIRTDIPRLRATAEHITQYVSNAVKLFSRIYLEKRLEHPADGILIEKIK